MIDRITDQLTLGVKLRDEAKLENFFVSAANAVCVQSLLDPANRSHLTYLWGPPACGRSHLLQALCSRLADSDEAAMYLPLRENAVLDPAILEGSCSLALVCLDDVDSICGNSAWEAALFSLYNTLLESDTRLLVTADSTPQQLDLQLADLRSRLQSGAVFQLSVLDDGDKCSLLTLRAANRGMQLPQAVAEYIVKRSERDPYSLMAVLDILDNATLQRGRQLTIPFVREVLKW